MVVSSGRQRVCHDPNAEVVDEIKDRRGDLATSQVELLVRLLDGDNFHGLTLLRSVVQFLGNETHSDEDQGARKHPCCQGGIEPLSAGQPQLTNTIQL